LKIDYFSDGIDTWMEQKNRSKGANKYNMEFLRKLKECDNAFAKLSTMNYFLVSNYDLNNCRILLSSTARERKFLYAARCQLKEYAVDPEWVKPIRYNIKKIQDRIEHVLKITIENLRLTDLYPYFVAHGFDILTDFETRMSSDLGTPLDILLPLIEEWNAEHREEITRHMESVRAEKEAYEHRLDRKKQLADRQKRIEREMAQEDKAIERLAKKEKHKREVEERKVERTFNYIFKH